MYIDGNTSDFSTGGVTIMDTSTSISYNNIIYQTKDICLNTAFIIQIYRTVLCNITDTASSIKCPSNRCKSG